MRVLILGGIGEALALARRLAPVHAVTYSIAGKGRVPDPGCAVRVGGFGGADGLAAFLRASGIELLIDATHPFAAQISYNAARAATLAGVPLWAYRRPAWRAEPGDDWRAVADWPELMVALRGFERPFFTVGLEPLRHLTEIPARQHWLVRCLAAEPPISPQVTLLCATGPFRPDEELALFRDRRIDVLVAKDSGGGAVEAKLMAARRLRVPVMLLARPALPAADRLYGDVERMAADLIGSDERTRVDGGR